MGHANYSNLCNFFVRLIYAKGRLSIDQAVEVAGKRGETLHASEGEYDAESGMVRLALQEYVHFLLMNKNEYRTSGYTGSGGWQGPYLVPLLMPEHYAPRGLRLVECPTIRILLRATGDNVSEWPKLADGIEEYARAECAALFSEWANKVRLLPELKRRYDHWRDPKADLVDDDWEYVDKIDFMFAPQWRARYLDVPMIDNVTH